MVEIVLYFTMAAEGWCFAIYFEYQLFNSQQQKLLCLATDIQHILYLFFNCSV